MMHACMHTLPPLTNYNEQSIIPRSIDDMIELGEKKTLKVGERYVTHPSHPPLKPSYPLNQPSSNYYFIQVTFLLV